MTTIEISAAYAAVVRSYLVEGATATRPANTHPLLDEEETEEMLQAYLLGTPAVEFAKRLENRDITAFEAASDPCPDRVWPSAENE